MFHRLIFIVIQLPIFGIIVPNKLFPFLSFSKYIPALLTIWFILNRFFSKSVNKNNNSFCYPSKYFNLFLIKI